MPELAVTGLQDGAPFKKSFSYGLPALKAILSQKNQKYTAYQKMWHQERTQLLLSGDSLNSTVSHCVHNGMLFATYDNHSQHSDCPAIFSGGWWCNDYFVTNSTVCTGMTAAAFCLQRIRV